MDIDIFNPQISKVAKGLEGKAILVYGGNNLGKAQPIDTLIPTPNGEVRLGDLKVGDYVFDRTGKPTKVLKIFEQGLKDNYKVTLRDGRVTYCNNEHLWTYFTSRNNFATKTLQEMIDAGIQKGVGYRFQIPVNDPVEYEEKTYSVDPYVVGCFLGDGCTTMSVLTLSSDDEEIVAEVSKLLGGKKYKRRSEKNHNWNFEMNEESYYKSGSNTVINFQTKDVFKDYPEIINAAANKRIPKAFFNGSVEQRFALLQGLMDTDGTIHKTNYDCRFDNTSKELVTDVVYLLHSLGISSTISEDYHKENVCYYVTINAPNEIKTNFFRLKRKREIAEQCATIKKDKLYDRISIKSVEKMDKQVEMRCIAVDNEESLYLTNDFIVTHNTKQATRMKKPFYLPFESGLNAIPGIPFCPINKWSDFIRINKQLTDPATLDKAKEMYSTIIFDEVEAAANYCQEFICQKYQAPSIGEGNGGYGLWKEYATEFWKQINKLLGAGYCCYFIAHAQEKDGFISPKADKRALDPIVNNVDVCVYVESNGVDEEGHVIKSSGYLAETDRFFARSRFDYLPTTYIKEFTAEALEDVIVKAIENQEKAEGIKAVSYEEQKEQQTSTKKSYDELMDELQDLGEKMADNGYLEDLQSIVTNQLGEGKKASDLKKGQEQLIEAIIYDIESFMEEHEM